MTFKKQESPIQANTNLQNNNVVSKFHPSTSKKPQNQVSYQDVSFTPQANADSDTMAEMRMMQHGLKNQSAANVVTSIYGNVINGGKPNDG